MPRVIGKGNILSEEQDWKSGNCVSDAVRLLIIDLRIKSCQVIV